jgi:hypothetical protein
MGILSVLCNYRRSSVTISQAGFFNICNKKKGRLIYKQPEVDSLASAVTQSIVVPDYLSGWPMWYILSRFIQFCLAEQ